MRRHRFAAVLAAMCTTTGIVLGTTAGVLAVPSPRAASASAPDDFVVRRGAGLELDGRPFRFGGPNIYWLGLDENVGGVAYPTRFRIRDALETARGMGATVVRSHTLGVSTGDPLSLEPSLDRFQDKAFGPIDEAVAEAHRLGLRLVVPLTDNWHYYHGGKADFTNWYGLPEAAFYSDPRAIGAFERYADHLLAHVNPLTGKAYKDDPTIMAWELGNELNGMTDGWVREISSHLKRIAPRQLVASGSQSGVDGASLRAPEVDIVDVHYYPPTVEGIRADAATVAGAGKAYLAGEYASGSATPELLDAVSGDADVSGALFWSLFGHADDHGFVRHDDGFTVHFPGDDAGMLARVKAITAFDRTLCGCSPRVPIPAPEMTATSKVGGENVLAWRGSALAAGYRVQRALRPGGPWTTLPPDPSTDPAGGLVSDNDAPWMDRHSPLGSAAYRVVPVGLDGRAGPASHAVVVPAYDGPNRPPGAFAQLSPVADASPVPTRPALSWRAGDNAAYYRLTVSPHADLSSPVIDVEVAGTAYRPSSELALDTTYRWRVTAVNVVGGTVADNAGEAFTTGLPVTPVVVDDFESYASDNALAGAYPPNTGGDPITPTLVAGESGQGMRLSYALGGQGYAGVVHDLPVAQSWWGYAGLRAWLRPDGSGRSVTVQFVASGTYWETTVTPTGTDPQVVELPFSAFHNPPWATPGPLDLDHVTQLSIYVGGASGSGTLDVDSVATYPNPTS